MRIRSWIGELHGGQVLMLMIVPLILVVLAFILFVEGSQRRSGTPSISSENQECERLLQQAEEALDRGADSATVDLRMKEVTDSEFTSVQQLASHVEREAALREKRIRRNDRTGTGLLALALAMFVLAGVIAYAVPWIWFGERR